MKLRLVQVDAFADRPFTGNPAAVMPLDSWIKDETLQAIAAENNLAETAFFVPSANPDADYDLRWFTPTVEVAMCGHATLASGHVLLSEHPRLQHVRFATRKTGILTVNRASSGYTLDLPAHKPSPSTDSRGADAMGLRPETLLFHENGYCVSVLADESEVRALSPDFGALSKAAPENFGHIVTAPGDSTDFVSRMFAPNAGINEDPVTGSAHAVIVPYWAERLGKTRLTAFQASRRGGYLQCELVGDRVILTGQCITVIEGIMRLPEPPPRSG